jgi:hypothetical protein
VLLLNREEMSAFPCRIAGSDSGFRQFREINEPIRVFENLLRAALLSLVPDLADAPWYIRESEVVNLFVFTHVVREFQDAGFDIGQISIEVPVRNVSGKKASVYADLIIGWRLSGFLQLCFLHLHSLSKRGDGPCFAPQALFTADSGQSPTSGKREEAVWATD